MLPISHLVFHASLPFKPKVVRSSMAVRTHVIRHLYLQVSWGLPEHQISRCFQASPVVCVGARWVEWRADSCGQSPLTGDFPIIPVPSAHSTHLTFTTPSSPTPSQFSALQGKQNQWEQLNQKSNSRARLAFHGGHPCLCPQAALLGPGGLAGLAAQPDLGHPAVEKGTDQQ